MRLWKQPDLSIGSHKLRRKKNSRYFENKDFGSTSSPFLSSSCSHFFFYLNVLRQCQLYWHKGVAFFRLVQARLWLVLLTHTAYHAKEKVGSRFSSSPAWPKTTPALLSITLNNKQGWWREGGSAIVVEWTNGGKNVLCGTRPAMVFCKNNSRLSFNDYPPCWFLPSDLSDKTINSLCHGKFSYFPENFEQLLL